MFYVLYDRLLLMLTHDLVNLNFSYLSSVGVIDNGALFAAHYV